MSQTVKEWMSGDPVWVSSEASADEALALMQRHGIRHLPVVDGDRRVVGVLSIDDLRAALPFGSPPGQAPAPADRSAAREWRVDEIATLAPQTIGLDDALHDAADRMADARIGCLPVVDAEGRLVAMLSETDLLRALATGEWTEGLRDRRFRRREP